MKSRIITLLLVLLPALSALSQIEQPVKWNFSSKKIDGNKYELIFKASIDPGWHLYSVYLPEGGPIATSVHFENEDQYSLSGKLIEDPTPEKHYDPSFDMELAFWNHTATIKQVIEANQSLESVKGYVEFMACNDEKCLPPEQIDFKIELKVKENVPEHKEAKSYWGIFFIAFFSGFAALLTPCVFPMIPMTVSFFTKQSKNKLQGVKNAAIYGFFIILIYVILGSAVVAIFGADSLNALSTNPWFNLMFFILLVVFAVSFLGAFEIILPSSWVNKADANADKGGILGSFFMALTLALVSFSCTGPVVGGILFESASHGGIAPIIGMLGFGTALALPFTLFAAFPGYLNSLPKSGGWLNSVKVVLGFLELALAFKFLSMADLVLDLHLLEREVYIAIWIAIFGALGFYLFGKIKLPHDSSMDHLPVSRLLLGLLVISFTIYMIPGLWGAPLKLISAFPPPMEYAESPEGVGHRSSHPINIVGEPVSKDRQTLEEKMQVGPQGIQVFEDYDDALAYAKMVNKPLFIDFTGKACVNCRQMEINVWSDPKVNSLLKNEYVVVSLYVDLRKDLPKEEQYISKATGKKIRTVGNKWSDFQISKYHINSQPYYVLVDHNEQNLIKPKAYEPDEKAYAEWLEKGLLNFKENN